MIKNLKYAGIALMLLSAVIKFVFHHDYIGSTCGAIGALLFFYAVYQEKKK